MPIDSVRLNQKLQTVDELAYKDGAINNSAVYVTQKFDTVVREFSNLEQPGGLFGNDLVFLNELLRSASPLISNTAAIKQQITSIVQKTIDLGVTNVSALPTATDDSGLKMLTTHLGIEPSTGSIGVLVQNSDNSHEVRLLGELPSHLAVEVGEQVLEFGDNAVDESPGQSTPVRSGSDSANRQ